MSLTADLNNSFYSVYFTQPNLTFAEPCWSYVLKATTRGRCPIEPLLLPKAQILLFVRVKD